MAPIIEIVDSNEFERAKNLLELARVDYTLPQPVSVKQIADLDTSDWVRIPYEFTDGKYQLDVDPARLSFCPAVEKVGKELNLRFGNTAEDTLGRKYIGNQYYSGFLRTNLALGVRTPILREEVDYLHLLYLGSHGEIKVYNVAGKQIDERTLKNYFEDITAVKNPLRGEFLDANFKTKGKELYINSNHVLDLNGNLVPKTSEVIDKTTLMRDIGISLENYITLGHTLQGLPNKDVKSGSLCYWSPRNDNNSVVGFGANSNRAYLICYFSPFCRVLDLGVRAVKQA